MISEGPPSMKGMQLAAGMAFALALLALNAAVAADPAPYKVADGTKVDKVTLEGWRTWRALACERCHGARQEGMVGPSLIDSMKRLSKEEFKQAILKGRSDGAIQPGRLEELK